MITTPATAPPDTDLLELLGLGSLDDDSEGVWTVVADEGRGVSTEVSTIVSV